MHKLKNNSIHNDYLLLLRRYGLKPYSEESSFADKYKIINKLSKQNKNIHLKKHFQTIIDAIKEIEKATGSDIIDAINRYGLYDGTNELYESVINVINTAKDQHKKLIKKIYINEFPTGDFNAYAKPTDNGILCLLHTGMLKLLYNVSISASYMISSNEAGYTYIDKIKRPLDKSREYIALCMVIYTIVDYILSGNINAKHISGSNLDPWGVIVATSLSYSMKNFVVAHEIGHAILGHFNKASTKSIITAEGGLKVIKQSFKEEYDSDLWAQSILWKSDLKNRTVFGISGGGLAFFTIYLMAIHIYKILQTSKLGYLKSELSDNTHPPAMERINRLNSFLDSKYKTINDREHLAPCAMLWRIKHLIDGSIIEIGKDKILVQPPNDIR